MTVVDPGVARRGPNFFSSTKHLIGRQFSVHRKYACKASLPGTAMLVMLARMSGLSRTSPTPGLHNKIPALKIFARGWVAQESIFSLSTLRFSRGWVRKDGNLVMETGCSRSRLRRRWIAILLCSGMRACYICLRSGWGSDGNVYNVLRGLRDFWKPSGV